MKITNDYLISKGFIQESMWEYTKLILTYTYDNFFDDIVNIDFEIYVLLEDNEIKVKIDILYIRNKNNLDCQSIELLHIQTQKQLEDLYLILSNKPL
jgi:hypothetical protein